MVRRPTLIGTVNDPQKILEPMREIVNDDFEE